MRDTLNKTILFMVLMLWAFPLMAFGITDAVGWVANQTGLTGDLVGWIGAIVVLPALGWLTKKINFTIYERAVYVGVYGFAQALNDLILDVKFLGVIWEKFLEPFFIKMIGGIFRIVAQIPLAFIAGLNSRGESLVD